MITLQRVFYALALCSLIQIIYYYPQMPQLMASHFDASGSANGWSSRNLFFGIYLAIITLLIAIFRLLPGWSANRQNFNMKIPNGSYWLAPQRREQTHYFFRCQMLVMGIAHLLLAIITIQLAILANLSHYARLHTGIFWVLGAYFAFLATWLFHFYRYFQRP